MSVHERAAAVPIRVLVVDDEEQPRADAARNLAFWGIEPVVVVGEGEDLLAEASRLARKHRCQLALVDNFLIDPWDRQDFSGRRLIGALLPTRSIMLSGYSTPTIAAEAVTEFGAVAFAEKAGSPEGLHNAVFKALHDHCALPIRTRLIWPEGLSSARTMALLFGPDPDVPPSQADELLARLFPRAHTLRLELLSKPTRTPSLAPRQRSIVLKVWEDDLQPVALKIARAQRITAEIANYDQHVRQRLLGLSYAGLDRHCVLWDIGGARYVYLGANLQTMRSFSEYYAESSAREIRATLTHLFAQTWGVHYRNSPEPYAGSLLMAYNAVWDSDWLCRLDAFATPSPWLEHPALPELRLPHPAPWLRAATGRTGGGPDRSTLPGLLTAVTHGDMLGDNMFVDDRRAAWVIDFERTGRGPILQDFVELEVDILTRLAPVAPEELPAFLALARRLVRAGRISAGGRARAGVAELDKAAAVIAGLRGLAATLTGVRDIRQYLWGMLFNTVFRATLLRDSDEGASSYTRALLLGGLICARLDELEARHRRQP